MSGAIHIYRPTPEVVISGAECPFCEARELVVARYYAFQDAACVGCGWHSTRPEWKAFTQMSMEEVARGKEMALRFLAERNGAELKFQLAGKRLVGGGDDHARDSAADAVGERGV